LNFTPARMDCTGDFYGIAFQLFPSKAALSAERHWQLMTVPDAANQVMNASTVQEMILVHPDAHTAHDR
jgi:hypothetical protein